MQFTLIYTAVSSSPVNSSPTDITVSANNLTQLTHYPASYKYGSTSNQSAIPAAKLSKTSLFAPALATTDKGTTKGSPIWGAADIG